MTWDDDYMELGETNMIPTSYGFLNMLTLEKFDHEGHKIVEDIEDE